MTETRQNWFEIPDIFRLAATLGAAVHVNHCIFPEHCVLYTLPLPELKFVLDYLRAEQGQLEYPAGFATGECRVVRVPSGEPRSELPAAFRPRPARRHRSRTLAIRKRVRSGREGRDTRHAEPAMGACTRPRVHRDVPACMPPPPFAETWCVTLKALMRSAIGNRDRPDFRARLKTPPRICPRVDKLEFLWAPG